MLPGLACAFLLAFALPTAAGEPDFPDDDLAARIARVNEGELRFLETLPETPVHHHHNRILITEDALADGWIGLSQCHEDLDPVAESQIVYQPDRIRAIRVLSSEGIGAVRVDGPSVQLTDVGRGAGLCLEAESKALSRLPDGGYRLQNGPYMRRFLDGFYPMRVSLEIRYPAGVLSLVAQDPPAQTGFRVAVRTGLIEAEARFEGRLYTRFDFCRSGTPDCPSPTP